ncbi:dual specificity mitogen-activated protein kinase kinase 6 isoform X4 [Kogia breviceps]|uniref:dual specificity mitogen-activated protein kinase kinase 6 isoform X4 n=1 Tax=Kogia breviceps TaxID=27615 RepID=UPI0034D1C046
MFRVVLHGLNQWQQDRRSQVTLCTSVSPPVFRAKESYVKVGLGSGNGRWRGRQSPRQVGTGRPRMTHGSAGAAVSAGATGARRRLRGAVDGDVQPRRAGGRRGDPSRPQPRPRASPGTPCREVAWRPGTRKKRNPGLKIPKEAFEQPQTSSTPPRDLDSKACISIGNQNFEVKAEDLEPIVELGRGAYGVVEKMRHVPSGQIMAVKRIRATVNSQEQKRLLMDLDISMRTVDCPFTVTFYGALFREGDVWICMELMDTSLDKFYKQVIDKGQTIPEDILGKIAVSIVKALEHLHSKLSVIHRDVKPSNVLINTVGQVKMCDFGISGYLVDSVAKTIDAGCKPYMAPERINPELNQKGYSVKSDIWSLGITMVVSSWPSFGFPMIRGELLFSSSNRWWRSRRHNSPQTSSPKSLLTLPHSA